jgi:cobalt/nickel transport system permease protein
VAAKTWITVLAMITFMAVTAFDMTLRGLQRMRCPGIIVALLAFMYRYIFLLVDEGERMTVARESRTVSMNAWRSLVSLSHLVGALFMRTFERGERIYSAMLSRGFTGEIMTVDVSRPARADAIALVVSAIYVVGVRYLGQFYGR